MRQRNPKPKPATMFIFLLVTLMIGGSCLLMATMFWKKPLVAVATATSDMPVPEIEMVTPTPEGKIEIDNLEKEMLRKLAKLPEGSPERFEPYGVFAQQAEGAGLYEKAEDYYKKAFELGPVAYKAYFAKPAADFQINYVYMFLNCGRPEEAVTTAKKVYEQEVKILGQDSLQAIDSGNTLADALGDAKQYKQKQTLSERLIALLEKTGRTKSGEYVTALRSLGESYQAQDNMPQAKRWYVKSQAVAKADPQMHLYTENLDQTLASFESIKSAPDSQ